MAKKIDHTGEVRRMNNGMMTKIVAYRNSKNIDIQFEDGTIVYHKRYSAFKKGNITNPNYNKLQIYRLGELLKMNNGMMAKIITYRSCSDIDIQFEDGTIIYHKQYDSFKKGNIANPNYNKLQISRLGEVWKMNNGMMAEIIAYRNNTDIDVQFEDGTIVYHKQYSALKKGNIANPNYKLMSQTSINELICSFYLKQIGFEKKKNMQELNGKELDLYHPNLNGYKIGIEYDGFKHNTKKDKEKNKLCKQNNIQLYRIRESYLPKLKSTSIDFKLTDNNPRSKELEQTLQLLIKNIALNHNISIPLSISFQRDEKQLDKFLKKYHNKYEKERLYEQRQMNNGMITKIIAYRSSMDIDVQFEDGTIVYHKQYDSFKKGDISKPTNRLGEIRQMNNGMIAKIIAYRSSTDIDIQFEDGTIVYHKQYNKFKKGNISNPNLFKVKRIGECRKMNCGMDATIIAYRNSHDIDIQFEDSTIVYHKSYTSFKKGNISKPTDRLVETRQMNNGMIAKIIAYRSNTDIDIQFEDGTIVTHKSYCNFKKGLIANPNYKIKTRELIPV